MKNGSLLTGFPDHILCTYVVIKLLQRYKMKNTVCFFRSFYMMENYISIEGKL